MTEIRKPRALWSAAFGVASVIWAAGTVLAFRSLDPIVATFLAILGITLLFSAYVARDWDSHSTYEERENARARRRAQKWERGAQARARDRARWESHQARQAAKADGNSVDS